MKSYEKENIKLLRSFYDAVSRGEFGRVREVLDTNVEWIEPTMPGLWFGGTHRGAEAVWNEVINPTIQKFDDFRLKMSRFYTVGEQVVIIGYFHGRAKTTKKELDAATAHVCTVRNGKIMRFQAFHDSANWLETLGLIAPELHRMAA